MLLLFVSALAFNDDDDDPSPTPTACVDKPYNGNNMCTTKQLESCSTSAFTSQYCCKSCKACQAAGNCIPKTTTTSTTPAPKPKDICSPDDGDKLNPPFNCADHKHYCTVGKKKKKYAAFMLLHCCKTCQACTAKPHAPGGAPGSGCDAPPPNPPKPADCSGANKSSTHCKQRTTKKKCMLAHADGPTGRRRFSLTGQCKALCVDHKYWPQGLTHCSKNLFNCIEPKGPAATSAEKSAFLFMTNNCCKSCAKCLNAGTCYATPAPTDEKGPSEWAKLIMESTLNPLVNGIGAGLSGAFLTAKMEQIKERYAKGDLKDVAKRPTKPDAPSPKPSDTPSDKPSDKPSDDPDRPPSDNPDDRPPSENPSDKPSGFNPDDPSGHSGFNPDDPSGHSGFNPDHPDHPDNPDNPDHPHENPDEHHGGDHWEPHFEPERI